ncbi:MAG: hypothetical protein ACTHNP_12230 [Solirubrobacterales bacterium]
MSRWETTSELKAEVAPTAVWREAYVDAAAWPQWNSEIRSAKLDGPLALGDGSRLVNTIYIEGALATVWRRILGPAAGRALPEAQRAVVELATGRWR